VKRGASVALAAALLVGLIPVSASSHTVGWRHRKAVVAKLESGGLRKLWNPARVGSRPNTRIRLTNHTRFRVNARCRFILETRRWRGETWTDGENTYADVWWNWRRVTERLRFRMDPFHGFDIQRLRIRAPVTRQLSVETDEDGDEYIVKGPFDWRTRTSLFCRLIFRPVTGFNHVAPSAAHLYAPVEVGWRDIPD
jgi:hypothetical protein